MKIFRDFHILCLLRSQVKYCLHRLYFAHDAVGWLLWDIELRHVGFGLSLCRLRPSCAWSWRLLGLHLFHFFVKTLLVLGV